METGVPVNGVRNGYQAIQIAHGVLWVPLAIVNVYAVQSEDNWVLVDAGLPGSGGKIVRAIGETLGLDTAPTAVILTHGHFDHIGALDYLLNYWDVPVYVHRMEMPYLTGLASYPPGDPLGGGGAMAGLSPLCPRGPIDLGDRVRALPDDGTVPGLPEWRWIHTPGHTPGHISLFRASDRVLIAGDAFATPRQESATEALLKPRAVSRPPARFSPDWVSARDSVRRLQRLEPEVAATSHGVPMADDILRQRLGDLADDFDDVAFPDQGRYSAEPAVANAAGGFMRLPPSTMEWKGVALLAAVAGLILGVGFHLLGRFEVPGA